MLGVDVLENFSLQCKWRTLNRLNFVTLSNKTRFLSNFEETSIIVLAKLAKNFRIFGSVLLKLWSKM